MGFNTTRGLAWCVLRYAGTRKLDRNRSGVPARAGHHSGDARLLLAARHPVVLQVIHFDLRGSTAFGKRERRGTWTLERARVISWDSGVQVADPRLLGRQQGPRLRRLEAGRREAVG